MVIGCCELFVIAKSAIDGTKEIAVSPVALGPEYMKGRSVIILISPATDARNGPCVVRVRTDVSRNKYTKPPSDCQTEPISRGKGLKLSSSNEMRRLAFHWNTL
jgi:hypothetical protein